MSMLCEDYICADEFPEPATPAEAAHWQRLEAERRGGYREAGLSEPLASLVRTLNDGLALPAVPRRAA